LGWGGEKVSSTQVAGISAGTTLGGRDGDGGSSELGADLFCLCGPAEDICLELAEAVHGEGDEKGVGDRKSRAYQISTLINTLPVASPVPAASRPTSRCRPASRVGLSGQLSRSMDHSVNNKTHAASLAGISGFCRPAPFGSPPLSPYHQCSRQRRPTGPAVLSPFPSHKPQDF
jgi:hypothetical protein